MREKIGLILGPVLFLILVLMPVPEGMNPEAMKVAAVAVLMAVFWISEAIPIPATALIPIALFPMLGVMKAAKVTAAYGNHLIYLFMGGFLIAMAIEKWQLHRRIALYTIRLVGTTPDRMILGFMLATAFLSAWISNTATTMIMVTIALAVLRQMSGVDRDEPLAPGPFGRTLMLAIAYAASIGGIATLIGTPPNAILAGVLEQRTGMTIGFAEWMVFGVPLSLTMLFLSWFYLTRFVNERSDSQSGLKGEHLADEIRKLGAVSMQEQRVMIIFGLVVACWLLRGFIKLDALKYVTDSSIAIAGAVMLFVIPSGRGQGEKLLDWASAVKIPWDIIVLFGGGFALAAGFGASGLTEWIGSQLIFLRDTPLWITMLCIVTLVIFLTEITSNTATASLLLPILAGFAVAMDIHPMLMMVGAALAASFAFMLPVATPPNAIAFSSRQFTIPEMVRAGIWLNLFGIVIISFFTLWLLPVLFELG